MREVIQERPEEMIFDLRPEEETRQVKSEVREGAVRGEGKREQHVQSPRETAPNIPGTERSVLRGQEGRRESDGVRVRQAEALLTRLLCREGKPQDMRYEKITVVVK